MEVGRAAVLFLFSLGIFFLVEGCVQVGLDHTYPIKDSEFSNM